MAYRQSAVSPCIELEETALIFDEERAPRSTPASLQDWTFEFQHTPPSKIVGRHRWPGSLEFQSYPFNSTRGIEFIDIWSKLAPSKFLTRQDQASCCCISKHYQYGPEYSTVILTCPWNPLRRCKWGFGIRQWDDPLSQWT